MRLSIKDAAVGYDDNPVQRHISFSVESGKVCCVLGPNGCGKSTLVKTILGMLPLLGGAITIDGEDVTSWSPARLAKSVAYVAQSHDRPFPFTVREAVMMGRMGHMGMRQSKPSREDWNIVENAMREMGIWQLRDDPYLDISGGEFAMTMFARALAQQPELLILDEPTAALDYGNAVRVISKVRKLAKEGFAVLMVTHNPDHAFMCGADVALFTRHKPVKFGGAYDIITRANIQEAYGINVKLVEFTHDNQELMRTCAPEFGDDE